MRWSCLEIFCFPNKFFSKSRSHCLAMNKYKLKPLSSRNIPILTLANLTSTVGG